MANQTPRFPALLCCFFAGVTVGFLLSPIKKGVYVRVYNGTGKINRRGAGFRAGSEKKT